MFEKIMAFLLLIAAIVFAGIWQYDKYKSREKERELRNQIVMQSKTIEVKDGLYQKQAAEMKNLESLLDNASSQVNALTEEVERQKLKLASVAEVAIYWKKAYEAATTAHQTDPTEPVSDACKDECLKLRTRVDFEKDFGFIKVTGHTVTNPPEGLVKVEQLRPLVLTIAMTQGPDKRWSALATTSEENVGVDIRIAGVNPYIYREKWYEKIGVQGNIALGDGLFGSLGFTYRVGDFDVGPMWGVLASDGARSVYGLTATWHPFTR